MNDTRLQSNAATQYEPGEIDRILRKADENPPVHPHLIEHLREVFKVTTMNVVPAGLTMAEAAIAHNSVQVGQQALIDYLATLVNSGQGVPEEENRDDELPRTEAESAGSDPRRPGTRERG